MTSKFVLIQQEAFDIGEQVALAKGENNSIGALVTFIGYVRDINNGQEVAKLTLEHYPGMVEQEIDRIIDEATERWSLDAVRVLHRVGALELGEAIVFVGVGCQHRGDAFAACEFIMDYLKTRAPFWKKEEAADGSSAWLEAKEGDQAQLKKWQAR